jgi:hypothetical protein
VIKMFASKPNSANTYTRDQMTQISAVIVSLYV